MSAPSTLVRSFGPSLPVLPVHGKDVRPIVEGMARGEAMTSDVWALFSGTVGNVWLASARNALTTTALAHGIDGAIIDGRQYAGGGSVDDILSDARVIAAENLSRILARDDITHDYSSAVWSAAVPRERTCGQCDRCTRAASSRPDATTTRTAWHGRARLAQTAELADRARGRWVRRDENGWASCDAPVMVVDVVTVERIMRRALRTAAADMLRRRTGRLVPGGVVTADPADLPTLESAPGWVGTVADAFDVATGGDVERIREAIRSVILSGADISARNGAASVEMGDALARAFGYAQSADGRRRAIVRTRDALAAARDAR